MEIVFLGTASMVPTEQRNHSAILLRYNEENLLFDCGEGTQRQLRIAKIAPPRITRIFLTHWHGDHFFGLPGLIENLSKNHYQGSLKLYGPKGTQKNLNQLVDAVFVRKKLTMEVNEIKKDGVFLKEKTFSVESAALDHSVPCIGYSFYTPETLKIKMDVLKKYGVKGGPIVGQLQKGKDITVNGKKITVKEATFVKPGKKVTILLDTRMCKNAVTLAKNADVLICESTFAADREDKAKEFGHLTAAQAATIAKKAKVKKLILTHFSQVYKNHDIMKKEAKEIFTNTELAHDFSIFSVE